MANEKFSIKKGPEDRLELLSSFAGRKAVEFEITDGTTVKVLINTISHEDGSGFSFIFEGYNPENDRKVCGWYGARRNSGWFEYK